MEGVDDETRVVVGDHRDLCLGDFTTMERRRTRDDEESGLISMGDFDSTYYLVEIPFFAALAGFCGIISGVVTKLIGFTSMFTPPTKIGRLTHIISVAVSCFAVFYAGFPRGIVREDDQKSRDEMGRGAHASVVQISRVRRRRIHPFVEQRGRHRVGARGRARGRAFAQSVDDLRPRDGVRTRCGGEFEPARRFVHADDFVRRSLRTSERDRRRASASWDRFTRQSSRRAALVGRQPLAGTFRATVSVVVIVLEGVGKSAFVPIVDRRRERQLGLRALRFERVCRGAVGSREHSIFARLASAEIPVEIVSDGRAAHGVRCVHEQS